MNVLTIPNTFANSSPSSPPSLAKLDANFTAVASWFNNPFSFSPYAIDTGTANNYVASLPLSISSLQVGLEVILLPANTNTGPSTLNLNGLGAVSIYSSVIPGQLQPSSIVAGTPAHLVYNGSSWILENPVIPNFSGLSILPMINGFQMQPNGNSIIWTSVNGLYVTLYNTATSSWQIFAPPAQTVAFSSMAGYNSTSPAGNFDVGVYYNGSAYAFELHSFNTDRVYSNGVAVLNSSTLNHNALFLGSVILNSSGSVSWPSSGFGSGGSIRLSGGNSSFGISNYYNYSLYYVSSSPVTTISSIVLCSLKNTAFYYYETSSTSTGSSWNGTAPNLTSSYTYKNAEGYSINMSSSIKMGSFQGVNFTASTPNSFTYVFTPMAFDNGPVANSNANIPAYIIVLLA